MGSYIVESREKQTPCFKSKLWGQGQDRSKESSQEAVELIKVGGEGGLELDHGEIMKGVSVVRFNLYSGTRVYKVGC